jgi:hypothetical protein
MTIMPTTSTQDIHHCVRPRHWSPTLRPFAFQGMWEAVSMIAPVKEAPARVSKHEVQLMPPFPWLYTSPGPPVRGLRTRLPPACDRAVEHARCGCQAKASDFHTPSSGQACNESSFKVGTTAGRSTSHMHV